jgi:hypothetical protein
MSNTTVQQMPLPLADAGLLCTRNLIGSRWQAAAREVGRVDDPMLRTAPTTPRMAWPATSIVAMSVAPGGLPRRWKSVSSVSMKASSRPSWRPLAV